MAKSKISKSVKGRTSRNKTINNKIDEIESNALSDLLKAFRILFVVVVILSVCYLFTLWIFGDDQSVKKAETVIQYDEILAGSSFNMNESEYLVVYYDFYDRDLMDMTSQIYTYSYSGEYRLYSVDMSNGFNKPYITDQESNKNPSSAQELLINGPTLIKVVNGKPAEYIEGANEISDYLNKDK